jgi:peptide/nickel transport system ATP-binding protein
MRLEMVSTDDVVIRVRNLKKWFPIKMGMFSFKKQKFVYAVDNISFDIRRKEILGVVGESGCGKTTTGRLLVRLETPTGGDIYFHTPKEIREMIDGLYSYLDISKRKGVVATKKRTLLNKLETSANTRIELLKTVKAEEEMITAEDIARERSELEKFLLELRKGSLKEKSAARLLKSLRERHSIAGLKGKLLKRFRRNVQMIFQDPYESLNPRFTTFDTVAEPLVIHGVGDTYEEREELVCKALEAAEMKPATEYLYRYPHELSGGQRQRVAIARALVLTPQFIVADEPVSMLDVSIRAGVMNLMLDLIQKFNIPYLFITHDVSCARYMSDRIAVMYLGVIVELGETEKVINNPLHPYTKALLSAVPVPDPTAKHGAVKIKGELPSPVDIPSGCRFHPRCPYTKEICKRKVPNMVEVEKEHSALCHFAGII